MAAAVPGRVAGPERPVIAQDGDRVHAGLARVVERGARLGQARSQRRRPAQLGDGRVEAQRDALHGRGQLVVDGRNEQLGVCPDGLGGLHGPRRRGGFAIVARSHTAHTFADRVVTR